MVQDVYVAWWAADAGPSCILGVYPELDDAKWACVPWVPEIEPWADEEHGSSLWVRSDTAGNSGTWHVLLMTVQNRLTDYMDVV